jgi:predicted nucleotidyltransferase
VRYIGLVRDIAREELIEKLLELKPVLEQAGVTHAALIGSRARQDNRADSDIDLVIEIDERRKFSLLDLAGVGHIIEDNVGLPANLFMRRSLDKSFQRTMARDQIPVF